MKIVKGSLGHFYAKLPFIYRAKCPLTTPKIHISFTNFQPILLYTECSWLNRAKAVSISKQLHCTR